NSWPPGWSGSIDDGNGNRVNFTGIEALSVTGSDAAERLAGTSGADVLDGRGGADTMEGGTGADIYHVDSLGDLVVETASDSGTDEIHTALASYTLVDHVEKLVGTSALGQALTGNGLYNTIVGGVGNDLLHGGGVGTGTGGDTLVGGKGNDVYIVTQAADLVQELFNEGFDEVRTALATYTLAATNIESLVGTGNAGQTLRGNAEINFIFGGSGNDRLEGMGGADTLSGGAGDDTMIGGTNNDFYYVNDVGDVVIENAGEGTDEVRTTLASYTLTANVERLIGTVATGQALQGNILANRIDGAAGGDQLTGGDGDDTLNGNGGNDVLVGSAGADTMRGGTGDDVYIIDGADLLVELAGEGRDEVRTAASLYTLAANFEILRAASDASHDFRGNDGDNLLVGGDGNDVLRLHDGGSDVAEGRNGVDSFYFGGAFDGGDLVDGGDNRDSLILQGSYNLTLVHAASGRSSIANVEGISLISGTSTQYGQAGTSLYSYDLTLVDGNTGAGALMKVNGFNLQAGEDFTLDASAETDAALQVYAGFGKDSFTGGQQGDAFIFGHDGRFAAGDSVNGGGGYDVVYLRGDYAIDFNAAGFENALVNVESIAILTSANNEFAGGGDGDFDYAITWADALLAAGATFTVNASRLQAHETFTFDGSAETNGVLRVFGGAAADTLTGGAGADQLHGGGGADVLTGGAGADLFRYSLVSDSTAAAMDVVKGFVAGTDRIDLNRVDARAATTDSNEAFAFIGANAFTAAGPNVPGELRAFNVAGDVWQVEGDVNGDGVADIVIQVHVEAGQSLGAADFVV
ncbi:MAG TPA: calcium-binding protein, partial [Allosphingosinicella sp.]